MTRLPDRPTSFWIASTDDNEFPSLAEPVSVDVAVLGAGIVGITAARELKRAGKTVALVESHRVVRGVTGYTTAKLTAGHNVIYSHLEKHFGQNGARLYAEANRAAVEHVARVAGEEGIDCDLERTANYVYSEAKGEVETLRREAEACARAGLPASFVEVTELPLDVAGAVRLENQAQFHPRKYLLPLVASLPGDGSHVFESTRALDVDENDFCRVDTRRGEIRARDVIVATHLPILDRGLFFAKSHPKREYVIAAGVDAEHAVRGMYISSDEPTRSIRTTPYEGGRLLIVGGEKHKTGQESRPDQRYERLAAWARERFGVEAIEYRWSTQDNFSVDRVPYVGTLTRRSRHVFVATGFSAWGMSNGVAAGLLLADVVLGRENPYAELYDANRLKPVASAKDFVKENANVARRFFGDRVAARSTEVSDLRAGEGRVVTLGGER
ncbi:MAG: FAD-binding oxidoreductase, partial [Actinomycetota bacterium]|nr:FAD-binding oxidoreductase [Actinomycetota bacterium]